MDLDVAVSRANELRDFLASAGSKNVTKVITVGTLNEAETILAFVKDERALTAMSFNDQPRVKSASSGFVEFVDPGGPLAFVVPAATLPHLLSDDALRRRLSPEPAPRAAPWAAASNRKIVGYLILAGIAAAIAAIVWTVRHNAQLERERLAAEARAEAEYARTTPPVEIEDLTHDASYNPDPVYPPAAKAAGIKGDVVVSFLIDENGDPVTVEVISGPPDLRDAALAAARTAHFYKFNHGGHYVRRKGKLIYHFGHSQYH